MQKKRELDDKDVIFLDEPWTKEERNKLSAYLKTRKLQRKSKVPHVITDRSLNKYKNVVLFPEKLAKANEMLRTVGMPKPKKKTRRA